MIVVSDASPLIGLASIGRLDLLRDVFERVLVPEAVYQEAVHDIGRPGAEAVLDAAWIIRHEVTNRVLVEALALDVDVGESEAIALALEVNADLIVVDDKGGRSVAEAVGLRTIGVLGVIVLAKQRGLIEHGRPIIDALLTRTAFRVSASLVERVLRTMGE